VKREGRRRRGKKKKREEEEEEKTHGLDLPVVLLP
jgi:hypothetical protein